MNAVPQRPKCFARLQDAHGLKGGLVWHVKRVKRLETELDSSRDAEAEVDSKLQELQAQHEQYVGKTDRKLAKLLAKLVRLQEEAQTCQQAKARAERQALQASTQLACKAREVDQLEEAAAAVDVRIMLAEVRCTCSSSLHSPAWLSPRLQAYGVDNACGLHLSGRSGMHSMGGHA